MFKISILCLICAVCSSDTVAKSTSHLAALANQKTEVQTSDTLRILFVGNSYTYFWGLAQIVEGLSENEEVYLSTRTSTASGASLNDHWHGRYNLTTREKIENGNWDVVVLQNQSRSSIDSLNQFMNYGKKFINLIKEQGAIPILFETWAQKNNSFMQDIISSAHDKLAEETSIQKVPIGKLWSKVREMRPNFELYDPDGSHPNTTGTYFNACIFFAFLTGEQASYLETRVHAVDHHGEKIQLSVQDEQDAMFLQNIIDTYLLDSLEN